jgi:[CysO sulfur-carrier protein]-S-L-cysteine hydrolase
LSIPFKLVIPRDLFNEMLVQAKTELPNECCGLLAGRVATDGPNVMISLGQVAKRYPLINELASPTEFLSEPSSLLAAHKDMRSNQLDILAIYHSHPTSEPLPSKKDRERNYGPDVANVIISLRNDQPEVRAWWITDSERCEADWEVKE